MSALPPIVIESPLAGWCLPLAEVPDPVFAERMAGDGVAIDPTGNTVHAPCDGEIVPMKGAKHAITVRHRSGVDVLVHVGIDTVSLGGEGFEILVAPGERVKSGQALLCFDLDALARRAPSLVTPVVLASGGRVLWRAENRAIRVGEKLLEIDPGDAAPAASAKGEELRRAFRVPFEHGLHVRPAAQVAAILRPFASEVTISARGHSANARSTVAMMSLGVSCGDEVEVIALGVDSARALAALEPLFAPVVAAPEQSAEPPPAMRGSRIEAAIASRGVAVGPALQWVQAEIPVAESGRGENLEAPALRAALGRVREHLASAAARAGGERRALLAAHAELVEDPELERVAFEWLRRGKSAGFAWREATRSTEQALAASADERMRERAADLRDLERQVLRVLGGEPPAGTREFPPGVIVLAEELLPSQLVALERDRVAGFCTARGGPTSHVALLASAAGLPALVAAGPGILAIAAGTPLVLDAENGWLDVDPPAADRAATEQAVAQRAVERAADLGAARQSCETRDRVRVVVNANLGNRAEVASAVGGGAEGCGLLRTEFLFLDRREAPDEEEQAREYQRIATALEGRPLSIRTLDVGGDKPIAYLPLPREENPALGLRGIRASFSNPGLLRTQLRAVLRVRPAGQCRVLLPMVTELGDLQQVREMLEEAARDLGMARPLLGAMIETPASALLASQLAEVADFLSIGTNDLAQYTLAIDRGHPQLARRLDALHPAVLRLIAQVAEAAASRGKGASVCGALASDVDALPILIGLGIRELSATPSAIPRLKRIVRLLDAGECARIAQRALESTSAAAARGLAASARIRMNGGSP